MSHDAKTLHKFYSSPLGEQTALLLNRQIGEAWESGRNLRVLGCGYTIPFMDATTLDADISLLALPEAFGALAWTPPKERKGLGRNCSVSVESGALPFSQNAFDRVLAAHFLENSPHLSGDLFEINRVLQPEGQLMLIVPNRLGLWARSDTVPFSSGLPFTAHQIRKALEQAGFLVERCETALHFAPSASKLNLKLSEKAEVLAKHLGKPGVGGVLVVTARKRQFAPKRPSGLGMRLRHLWELAPRPKAPIPAASKPVSDRPKSHFSGEP